MKKTSARTLFPALCAAFLILAMAAFPACQARAPKADPRLGASSREDRAGWIHVRLAGAPAEIGFQHGWHLAAEIDDLLRTFGFYLKEATKHDWAFFRAEAERLFWPRLEPEYQEEIAGIAEGLNARLPGKGWNKFDIAALNGWIELAWYYVPYLEAKTKTGPGASKAPGYCSAFIATGSYTADGRIVMGHNSWVEYIIGERWNVILDIAPAKGHRILMDALPGYIHSGDDFVINAAGIVYTETTISKFKSFDEGGVPEFARARKAAQYADSIDDFISIMTAGGNGAYANDWLVGDIKTNEIAKLELGLKNHPSWRTKDGYFIGSNFASDPKLISEETTFDAKDASQSVFVRKARWEKLMADFKGKIDAETGKSFEADHIDASTGRPADNANVLCGHVDADAKGVPEFDWAPFFPGGSVQGKVTTAALAKEMKMWARMGHPCGADFLAEPFFAKHPEYKWQGAFLRDMKANPWALFEAGK